MRLFTVDIDVSNLKEKQDHYLDMPLAAKKKHRDQEKSDILSKIEQGTMTSWDIYA